MAAVGEAVLVLPVPGPVLVPVVVGEDDAEAEDGFGAVGAPAGAGDVHAVFDQVAAGAFDDAGGDRPAAGQEAGVVQVGGVLVQVADGAQGDLVLAGGQGGSGGGLVADGGGDLGRVPVEDGAGVPADPGAGVRAGRGEEAPGGIPQVLGDVDDVDEDGQGRCRGRRPGR